MIDEVAGDEDPLGRQPGDDVAAGVAAAEVLELDDATAEVDSQPGLEGDGRRLDHDRAELAPRRFEPRQRRRRRGAPRGVDRLALLVDAGLGAAAQRLALPREGRLGRDEAAHVRRHAAVDHAARFLVPDHLGARPRQPVALVAADVVVVPVRVQHPAHRLVGPAADERDVGVGARRQVARVDDEHLAIADDDGGVAVGKVVGRVGVADRVDAGRELSHLALAGVDGVGVRRRRDGERRQRGRLPSAASTCARD